MKATKLYVRFPKALWGINSSYHSYGCFLFPESVFIDICFVIVFVICQLLNRYHES